MTHEPKLPESTERPTLHVLSDTALNTAEHVVRAALSHFGEKRAELRIAPPMRSAHQIEAYVEALRGRRVLIVHTLLNPTLSEALHDAARAHALRCHDILGPLMARLGTLIDDDDALSSGDERHQEDMAYRRFDAIEYTVSADDGRAFGRLHRADIVLVGLSRTSKTPVASYLAGRGFKVANVPLVPGVELNDELRRLDNNRVVALTLAPNRLTELRVKRMRRLGIHQSGAYDSIATVRDEVEWAEALYRSMGWHLVRVEDLAIEELADEILSRTGLART